MSGAIQSAGLLASIGLGRPGSLLPVGCLFAATLALTLWSYSRLALPPKARALAWFLKTLGFLLLLTCWLEPQWLQRVPRERANAVALLLDDSRSMQLPDAHKGSSRGERLQRVWNEGAATWRHELERDYRTLNFTFAGGLTELGKSSALEFNGGPTALGSALSQVVERLGERPAGIVVLTDGVASDLNDLDAKTLPPVFPVVFGRSAPGPDLALGAVNATSTAFEDAPVTVAVEVLVAGVSEIRARVRLEGIDTQDVAGGVAVAVESFVTLKRGQQQAGVQLQFSPKRSGATFYRVSVDSPDLAPEAELTLENNTRLLCVNRSVGPHRLLYVAGRPNWEFGPMRRALDTDSELQLLGLIRVAKREPKFAFKGRGGESSNPLFRGFQKGEDGSVQKYDKPVLVRVNVETRDELAAGFPKTAEELFGYKGIILDDVEAEFFTPEQQRLLQRFVAERGGGLLMLGGMESFEGGGWKGTPVEAALPVWLGKDSESGGTYQWKLSREGLLEPWVRQRKAEAQELERMDKLPAFEILNGVAGIKPAASVLAWGISGPQKRPALVTQRYGSGRSGALLAGDLYQWGIGDPTRGSDLAKFWRQVARWLVADVPSKVEMSIKAKTSDSSTVVLVHVRDGQARAVEDAEVEIRVRKCGEPEAATVLLRAEPTPEPGTFSVEYPGGVRGGLVGEATARSADGELLGTSSHGWVQDASEVEFRSISPDRKAMEELAEKTGGAVVEVEQLESLPQRLKNVPDLVVEVKVKPLWHTGMVFGLALLCLCGEWLVRRKHGAA